MNNTFNILCNLPSTRGFLIKMINFFSAGRKHISNTHFFQHKNLTRHTMKNLRLLNSCLILMFVKISPSSTSLISCSELMPANYDSLHPPHKLTQSFLQATVSNIGDIRLRDQVIRTAIYPIRLLISFLRR